MGWLERYGAGDRVQVWTEMAGTIDRATSDAAIVEEAEAVADATMQRARTNVERLLHLLPKAGYVFAPGDEAKTFVPPSPTISDEIVALEARIGPLPLSLRSWFLHVGEVNLIGTNDTWGFQYTDPLVVQAPVDFILSEHASWEEDQGTAWDRGPFVIDIAPDYLHKANVSGGAPYAVAPSTGADGLVLFERHQTTFTNYLRIAFSWAGLPGWDPRPARRWATPNEPAPPVLQSIAAQLLPI